MAEKRAAFSLRRRRSLGFSKCRWLRTTFKVPSRSIFFFRRRRALSTDSPFFNLISVNLIHFLSAIPGVRTVLYGQCSASVRRNRVFRAAEKSIGKNLGSTLAGEKGIRGTWFCNVSHFHITERLLTFATYDRRTRSRASTAHNLAFARKRSYCGYSHPRSVAFFFWREGESPAVSNQCPRRTGAGFSSKRGWRA